MKQSTVILHVIFFNHNRLLIKLLNDYWMNK